MILTDKYYWHRYLDEYERLVFSRIQNNPKIMEFGVWKGESIRYFAERFPSAEIYGVDIIPEQPEWPKSPRIHYYCADQSHSGTYLFLREMEAAGSDFDLIIDDGSHKPHDQALCLIKSFPLVRSSGYYILEDIHTSFLQRSGKVNAFHVLLAIQHLQVSNLGLTDYVISTLTSNSYFDLNQLVYLFCNIKSINLFKRTSLPLLCYKCLRNEFDYVKLVCNICQIPLCQEADSMSFIIKKVD